MIVRLAAATVLLVAGCGSNEERASATARIDKCTQSFLAAAKSQSVEVRRYVQTTYCERFEQRGWIYDDGTLKIAAYTKSGTEECAEAQAGGAARTVTCQDRGEVQTLDCALLQHVRRDEVQEYIEDLLQRGEARCDDGTPLADLGAN